MTTAAFRTIMILGGTGSFGQAMTRYLLGHTDATIRIYSRDEVKQYHMAQALAPYKDRLRFLIGDVRDMRRLAIAMRGVDCCFLAAALKRVEVGEYNPDEMVATNVQGAINASEACMEAGVHKAIFLSSDKAVESLTCYGSSKHMAEKLWIRSNSYDPQGCSHIVTRWGNVTGSRGSVLEIWREQMQQERPFLTLTDSRMTRFYATLDGAVRLAWFAALYGQRGYTYVPHLPAYLVCNLLQAAEQVYSPRPGVVHDILFIGIRAAEKLHESLMTDAERETAWTYSHEGGRPCYYAIPPIAPTWPIEPLSALACSWAQKPIATPYRSDIWPDQLCVNDLCTRLALQESEATRESVSATCAAVSRSAGGVHSPAMGANP